MTLRHRIEDDIDVFRITGRLIGWTGVEGIQEACEIARTAGRPWYVAINLGGEQTTFVNSMGIGGIGCC